MFDAYGTLFDVNAAARRVLSVIDADLAMQVATDWRQKQLQYTWVLSLAGAYASFWDVTRDSLDWTIEKAGMPDAGFRDDMLELYRTLDPYPEVENVLGEISSWGCRMAILSNGTPEMLEAAVGAAGLTGRFHDIFSVEEIGVYKPDRRVYNMVNDAYGTPSGQTLFVSSNGWDVAGAASFGFRTVWVNRAGDPVDRLPWKPDMTMNDLSELPVLLEDWA